MLHVLKRAILELGRGLQALLDFQGDVEGRLCAVLWGTT